MRAASCDMERTQTSSNRACRIFGSDARVGTIIDWVELVRLMTSYNASLAGDGKGMVSALSLVT